MYWKGIPFNKIWGGEIMKNIYKKLGLIFIILLLLGVLLIIKLRSSHNQPLKSPNPEDLEGIVLISFLQGKGTNKITIREEEDMEEFLQVFTRAERTKIESTSEFPDMDEFILVISKFRSGGNGIRSLYREDGEFFIDQPFDEVFKIDKNDIGLVDHFLKAGSKEMISIDLDDMLDALVKDNF